MRRYPSMQGGVQPSKRRLRLQMRVSAMKAAAGATCWSAAVPLDAQGGASVVAVPYPMARAALAANQSSPAVYLLAVSASQVGLPGCAQLPLWYAACAA